MDTIAKYIVEKNLFSKFFCIFVSAYSISVIYSLWNHTGLSGLMGIAKFLEWVHFDALAKPVAEISTFLQKEPWTGGSGIIALVASLCLLLSTFGMGRIDRGGMQVTAFTLWSFVLIDFNVAYPLVTIFVGLIISSYMIDKKISLESFLKVVMYIFLSVIYIPVVAAVILSGNIAIKK